MVYSYNDYKQFLLERIKAMPNQGRGVRRRLAEAIGCQVAFVSHVLSGEKHFSLEHIEGIAHFFSLREDELDFLILLVQHNRAATPRLKVFFERKLKRRRQEQRQLKSRVSAEGEISEELQGIYYGSWHFQALRALLTIPEYRTPEKISAKLSLPLPRVMEILEICRLKGLVTQDAAGYRTTQMHVHLGQDSAMIGPMHTNWRTHAIGQFAKRDPSDFHYSAAVTVSKKDYEIIRERMTRNLLELQAIIKPSREEELCVLTMDFYKF